MPASSPKARVLRAAVIVDDLICDELHQADVGPVSAGSDYRNDLLLFGAGAPSNHRLFDVKNGDYYLEIPAHARGKISLGKKRVSVSKLRAKFGRDEIRLRLPSKAKGKLAIGDTTVLFQFAPPRPVPPKPPFPKYLKPKFGSLFSRLEAATLAVAAVFLGTFFAYASNIPVDSTIDPSDIDDRFARVMGIQKDEPEPEPEEETEETLAQEDEEEVKEEEPEPEPEPKKEKPKEYSEKDLAKARSVGVARVLGTYGGPGEGTVFDVIQGTENKLSELFDAGMTTTVLADGGDIVPFVPGAQGVSVTGEVMDNAGLETGDRVELAEKGKKKERKVKGKLKVGGTDVFGDVDKRAVKATIRQRMGALRHCYEKTMRSRPGLEGKMTFTITVSMMGSVTRVAIEEDTLGDSGLKSCVKSRIKGWRFPIKAEEPWDTTFPVVFSGA